MIRIRFVPTKYREKISEKKKKGQLSCLEQLSVTNLAVCYQHQCLRITFQVIFNFSMFHWLITKTVSIMLSLVVEGACSSHVTVDP